MRKYLIIISIISLFLIAGCEDGDDISTGDSPYIGGENGLEVVFESFGIEENGVDTIYDDETFPIQLLVNNKGEYDLEQGKLKIKIKGIYLNDFSGIIAPELTNDEEIEGISEFNSNGDEITIDFGSEVKYIPEINGDFVPLEIQSEYIYNYKTTASVPKVCFVEDLRDDNFCNVDEDKTVYSSGAPIQVKAVTEQPAGAGKISLKFELKNVGGGDAAIPGEEFTSAYDKVRYTIIPETEAARWKCSAAGSEGEVRFSEDEGVVICKLNEPLDDGEEYTKEILIEFEYDYRDFIQESLRIKNSE